MGTSAVLELCVALLSDQELTLDSAMHKAVLWIRLCIKQYIQASNYLFQCCIDALYVLF